MCVQWSYLVTNSRGKLLNYVSNKAAFEKESNELGCYMFVIYRKPLEQCLAPGQCLVSVNRYCYNFLKFLLLCDTGNPFTEGCVHLFMDMVATMLSLSPSVGRCFQVLSRV